MLYLVNIRIVIIIKNAWFYFFTKLKPNWILQLYYLEGSSMLRIYKRTFCFFDDLLK